MSERAPVPEPGGSRDLPLLAVGSSIGLDSPSPLPQYPRRAHRKSRTGCTTCKARKVKCDERHPACLNCITYGVNCSFLLGKPPAPPVSKPRAGTRAPKTHSPTYLSPTSPLSSVSLPTAASPADLEHDDLPLLELELLHNFTTQTYSTLAADSGVCDFWRVTVVEIGLRCDYIMRAVLAISALHLAYHRPDRRDFYTAQGIVLHQRAARSAMRFIAPSGIDSLDDKVNLFLFSMLTVYFALASPRRSLADGSFFIIDAIDPSLSPSASPSSSQSPATPAPSTSLPDWTFLINGAKSLSRVLGSQGQTTVLAPFLAYGHIRYNANRETPRASTPLSVSGVAALRERILAVVPPLKAGLLAIYSHALDELELALVARQDAGTPRDVLDAMLWLWEVSDSLVPLLKSSDPAGSGSSPVGFDGGNQSQNHNGDGNGEGQATGPAQEAVAIFAHFSILLRHHESHWWLQGWAEHLISRAYEILDAEHRSWIEWPMNEVGWMPPAGGS